MQIRTGGTAVGSSGSANRTVPGRTELVLFDPSTPVNETGVLVVGVNTLLVITAYNIIDTTNVYVERVIPRSPEMATGCMPCPTDSVLSASQVGGFLYRGRLNLGGHDWKLDHRNRHLVISLPGFYMLSIDNPQPSDKDSLVVTARFETGVQTMLPDVYYAGVTNVQE